MRGLTISWIPLNGGCAILAGMPFVLMGIFFVVAVFWHEGEFDLRTTLAPIAIGALMSVVGMLVIVHGVRDCLRKAGTRRRATEQPGQNWYADYPWNTAGASYTRFRRAAVTLAVATFWAVSTAIAGIVLIPEKEEYLTAFVGLLAVVGVGLAALAAYEIFVWVKYGPSHLRFERCPYFLGEKLQVTWIPPRGLNDCIALTATLRAVEETYGEESVGKFELYEDTTTIHNERASIDCQPLSLEFDIPTDAPATRLNQRPPTYWELEVIANRRGRNYSARFLLPIYDR